MKRPFDPATDALEEQRAKVLGLGLHSARKSYYPAFRARLSELERFRAALDGSNDAILLVELAGGTLDDANETACRMLRRPRGELIGQRLGELQPALVARLGRAAELPDGHRETVETTLRPAGGGEVHVEVTLSLVRIDGERYAIAVARDVSERRRGQRALKLLAEAGAIVSSSLDLAAIPANLARVALPELGELCCVYRRAPGGPIERLALTFAHPTGIETDCMQQAHREAIGEEFGVARAIESGQAEIVEVTAALLAASARDAEHLANLRTLRLESVLVAPFVGGPGTSGALLFAAVAGSRRRYDEIDLEVARQLAQRVAMALENARLYQEAQSATQRAEESLAQLDTLLARAPVGIAFMDRDLRYVRANAALGRIDGVPSEQMIGRTVDEQIPELAPTVGPLIRAVLATGEPVLDVEVSGRLPSAPLGGHWLASYYPVRTPQGALLGVGALIADITGRKRAEVEREQLLERERAARVEAERASRIKDEFVATVSHELRTPLNAILGWTQLMGRPGMTLEKLAKGLAVVERNARLLTQLVADLLDTSRIASGKLSLDCAPLDLAAVVEAAIEGLRSVAQAKGVELRVAGALGDALVLGDPGRLQQVVSNLVSNAIEFTPRAGRVDVTLTRSADHVGLAVRDTGQGIEPEFLPHVFDRFRQADASTARRHGGLGLGLAIVKHVVDLHGGAVRADSAGSGKGACFTVELPAASARATAAAARNNLANLRGASVLLVEDEPDARELFQRVLEEHGAEVRAVPSAPEALQALAEYPFDVMVSDIGLPGMDGYELMRQIRAGRVPIATNIPAVALTAFARPEDRALALGIGFQAHVTKPVDCAALVAEVASLVGRHKADHTR